MEQIITSLGIQWQGVLAEIICFILMVILLNRFLYKPLFGAIDQRQNDIKATYDQLDQDRDAMAKTRKEYEDRLAGIETEARDRIQAAVKEAQDLAAGIKSDATKQAEALIDKARADADRDRERVFTQMKVEIVDLALSAASKIIGENMDTARHQALVSDFISSVSANSTAKSGAATTL